jgi:rsbT co-antagonist protein RsbR
MGVPTIAIETQCVAQGAPHCVVQVKDDESWGPEADPWRRALQTTDKSLSQELERKLHEVEEYRRTVAAVGTPIIEVWNEVVALPIIGAVDGDRGEQIMATLVDYVARHGVRCVLLDLTGVQGVDTHTADIILKMVRSVGLLGARCLVTGVPPEVARTLTLMRVPLDGLRMLRSLKQGLEECLHFLGGGSTGRR